MLSRTVGRWGHERVLSDRPLECLSVVYIDVKGLLSSIHDKQENANVLERCFDARLFLIPFQCRILVRKVGPREMEMYL